MHVLHKICLLCLLSLSICLNSCEEIGPPVDLEGFIQVDTTIENPKIIMLEEFTGVRCTNCPQAHEIIETLEANNPGRIVAVSIHSQFQSQPYGNDQDLHVMLADDLNNFIGPTPGKPFGSVDRKLFSAESELLVDKQKWALYVNQQLQKTAPLSIDLTVNYEASNRNLDVKVMLEYFEDIKSGNRLSIMILEDSIVTTQLDNGKLDTTYVQNQVLRDMMTPHNGVKLNDTINEGAEITRNFSKNNLPVIWREKHLKVVAFVHSSVGTKEVLQAAEIKVKN